MRKYYWFYICSSTPLTSLNKGTIVFPSLQEAVRNAKGRPLFFYRLPKTAEVNVAIENNSFVYQVKEQTSVVEL